MPRILLYRMRMTTTGLTMEGGRKEGAKSLLRPCTVRAAPGGQSAVTHRDYFQFERVTVRGIDILQPQARAFSQSLIF